MFTKCSYGFQFTSEDQGRGKLLSFLMDLNSNKRAALGANVKEELEMDVACVQFFRETRGLNKEMVGTILGKTDEVSRRHNAWWPA